MKSEFDRAETLYEKIIQNKPDEPEAHWGLILCKFGIEYVEDPKTFKRIPTCHRTSFDSITADDDYKEALKYSDSIQRTLYENEAKEIDRIQKEILALSNKEEPYDVFICYKETDENGQRTPDSAIANDIYHQLTNEGFKVFYAAISLEDKLGSAYEPCIFAALNSSKVMLAIGTKPEYFNAVWVKNEWSRFLKMMKNDKSKLLIPCYKGMDAYDLPDEFAHLQAQDMNKIGFINDIVRGIKKVIVKDKPKPENTQTVVVNTHNNANVQSLLKRVFIFLGDGDFKSADEYCEKVLDIEPENAQAYLGKLMAELHVKQQDEFKNLFQTFEYSSNYQKIMKFGDDKIKSKVQSSIDYIHKRNYLKYCEDEYQRALSIYSDKFSDRDKLTKAKEILENISDYKDSEELIEQYDEKVREHEHNINERNNENKYKAACELYDNFDKKQIKKARDTFESLSGYKDSNEMIIKCDKKIKEFQNAEEYKQANNLVSEAKSHYNTFVKENIIKAISEFDEAIKVFEKLGEYNDSPAMIEKCISQKQNCQKTIDDMAIAEQKRKHNKKMLSIIIPVTVLFITGMIIVTNVFIIPLITENKYKKANALIENGQYNEAVIAFSELGDYKDSKQQHDEILQNLQKTNNKQKTISAGSSHTVGLRVDGTVVAAKENGYDHGECNVSNWNDIIAISAGDDYTIGLKKDGAVVATGYNNYGQCNVSDWKDIIAVSAGSYHTVGLKKGGTVVATGSNRDSECNVSNWENIVAVSAGCCHTVGLKVDGTVIATRITGYSYGQCNVSDWKDIIAVSAGAYHTIGLKKDGTIVGTGKNYDGECNVSDWKATVAISAGDGYTIGLKKDGTVVATGKNDYDQCNVSDWKDIVAVSAGDNHTVGLKADGTVVATGSNSYGQCDVWGLLELKVN